ncbi:Hypothetical protein PFR_JS13-2_781 [Propionibacterium freudenreichii]|uniref:hypothetical protein n=1 Tax=Propionibacterium freudenreichii TaxID=1744 RepID=UPI000BC33A5D|nr:hypothetical protein [Propionibacterium freudenreichii]SBN59714.1 Hypothetical protein PFR_JS11_792 [Propionibacterium freudenreichii]SBN95171.1 Hypothetical protein PFR_JS12-2_787 [Propionibacterium freudenreichii]SCC96757.1 Hypothetical protein PFR_JS12-1_789 [Propionibacterium freudenreichii]SCQ48154.1 Hypothetical protein PFR_JS13-1_792 [Propionibacterium freudenreichii]SCQ52449.1 Hypothetical protein PFR_JS13-2_781 [Propionibacterium freudenreichii]
MPETDPNPDEAPTLLSIEGSQLVQLDLLVAHLASSQAGRFRRDEAIALVLAAPHRFTADALDIAITAVEEAFDAGNPDRAISRYTLTNAVQRAAGRRGS